MPLPPIPPEPLDIQALRDKLWDEYETGLDRVETMDDEVVE